MRLPVVLVLAACFVTVLEFPYYFANVVASDGLGLTLLFLRNGLLVAATLMAARALWRATVPPVAPAAARPRVSPADPADMPATAP
jgi:hypothetical protein